ncbi:hypothetical protein YASMINEVIRUS_755 [Yasminevirus sp. GU-2018]|uniref:Uncharacterized protein n=1 Tax=Yasminevirus sp. GU-2018 TaxID=2420051 RepID=A0A5K0U9X9_9VIRU|nr:hypothetical protein YASMINEVIRUS_755 [Yasminevirus sp. GU-2018]
MSQTPYNTSPDTTPLDGSNYGLDANGAFTDIVGSQAPSSAKYHEVVKKDSLKLYKFLEKTNAISDDLDPFYPDLDKFVTDASSNLGLRSTVFGSLFNKVLGRSEIPTELKQFVKLYESVGKDPSLTATRQDSAYIADSQTSIKDALSEKGIILQNIQNVQNVVEGLKQTPLPFVLYVVSSDQGRDTIMNALGMRIIYLMFSIDHEILK